VDQHWYEALVQDLDAGRRERLDRYMVICAMEMGERRMQGDEVLSPLDVIGGPLDPATDNTHPREPLTSVTPPLGSSASAIEIDLDLAEFEDEGEEAALARGDTRASASIPESSKRGQTPVEP
jgi:hypothetical protein